MYLADFATKKANSEAFFKFYKDWHAFAPLFRLDVQGGFSRHLSTSDSNCCTAASSTFAVFHIALQTFGEFLELVQHFVDIFI